MQYLLTSSSNKNALNLWDPQEKKMVKTFSSHLKGVKCALVYDGDKIIVGLRDDTIKIFDMKLDKCLSTLVGHEGKIYCLKVVKDHFLASGSEDKQIKLWDLKDLGK